MWKMKILQWNCLKSIKTIRNSWILFDDVVDMLHSLEGYRLGIISNGKSIQQRAKLSCTNIENILK